MLQFVMNHDNVDLIANIRKDTALYKSPTRTGNHGHPRKYGDKFDIDDVIITDDNGAFKVGRVIYEEQTFNMVEPWTQGNQK